MNQFLNYKYYLTPTPNFNFQFSKITLGIIIAVIILGIIWAYYRKKVMKDKIARKLLRPYPGKLITYGFIGFFLLLFREAGIPYLSMRLWWVILVAFVLYDGIKLALNYNKEYERRAQKMNQNMRSKGQLKKKK